jgi:hypothetical protein
MIDVSNTNFKENFYTHSVRVYQRFVQAKLGHVILFWFRPTSGNDQASQNNAANIKRFQM